MAARKWLKKSKNEDNGEVYLTINKLYTVYKISFYQGLPYYLLCSEESDDYPITYDPALFEIIDRRLSSFWRLSNLEYEDIWCSTLFVFDEWAKDPMFFEKLLDGEPEEVAIFSRYRKLMDVEFIDKSQIEKAIQIEVTGEIIEGENKGE